MNIYKHITDRKKSQIEKHLDSGVSYDRISVSPGDVIRFSCHIPVALYDFRRYMFQLAGRLVILTRLDEIPTLECLRHACNSSFTSSGKFTTFSLGSQRGPAERLNNTSR